MKYIITILLLWAFISPAQTTVEYCIKNEQTIGSTFEYDVFIRTDASGTLLGDGIFYIDYNATAFGNSVVGSGGFSTVRDNNGSILGSKFAGVVYIYSANGLLINNNTASRFAVTWEIDQQSFAASLTATEQLLVHIQMNIVSTAEAPSVSFFESLMENETYESTNVTALTVDIANCAALPVEGLELRANRSGDRAALLQWSTQREFNTDFFELERTNGQEEFITLARVKAAGTSYEPVAYRFTDDRPAISLNRYRVRLVDLDGNTAYSNLAEVRIESGPWVRIFPNPSKGKALLQVFGEGSENFRLRFYDMEGREVLDAEYPWNDGTTYEVNLGYLPEGVYLYRLESRGRVWTERLTVIGD